MRRARWLALVLSVIILGGLIPVLTATPAAAAPSCAPLTRCGSPPPCGVLPGPCDDPPPTTPPPPPSTPPPSGPGTDPPGAPPPPPGTGEDGENGQGAPGLAGQLFGDDGVDLSHYDLGYDEGAWNNITRKVWGNLTELAWSAHRWVVSVGIWVMTWTWKFGIADLLIDPVNQIAQTWRSEVVDRLGLPSFFFFITCLFGAFLLLRGRGGRAAAEIGTSLGIAAVTSLIMTDPGGLILGDHGLLGRTRDFTYTVAALTLGEDAPDPGSQPTADQIVQPMRDAYVHAMIVEPHMILDWGRSLDTDDVPAACRDTYTDLIERGPWGTDDTPREEMVNAGCQEERDFNHRPTAERLGGAMMVGFAGLCLTILIIVISGVVALAQISLALVVIKSAWSLAAGLLPGPGRQDLLATLTTLLRAMATVIASMLFLAIFLLLVRALLQANGQSLMARLITLDLLVVFGFVFRSRLTRTAERAAARLSVSGRLAGSGLSRDWRNVARLGLLGGGQGATGMGRDMSPTTGQLWSENRREAARAIAPGRVAASRAAATGRSIGRVIHPAPALPAGETHTHAEASGTQSRPTPRRGIRTGPGRPQAPAEPVRRRTGAGTAPGGRSAPPSPARTARGVNEPRTEPPGLGARLRAELDRTRGGRAAVRTARIGRGAVKLGWALTGGLPITLVRTGTTAHQAAHRASERTRQRLTRTTRNTQAYGRDWANSVRTLTGPLRLHAISRQAIRAQTLRDPGQSDPAPPSSAANELRKRLHGGQG